ncbi:T9SS type A sorting domain-containing protein [Winogradskyella aurantia]|uniref:Secretion system C-terminal sorting domain-containing protein n=1 Tax=Winogradskyella aurantia TaxID=1915063 RepID=A0A265UX32_9FLAO|nr:T9SS type A sorting domain-containing protein [Winogradskyella aurantia]OZV69861.1 hypothetical protein CA834_04370 [Winogradskyella aurantia]
MTKRIIGCLLLMSLATLELSSQETFKVMFYNLLNYPIEDAVPNREDDLEFILADYQPDLFLVCELNTITGANNVLNIARTAINQNMEMATYVSNTSDDSTGDQNDLQNLLYYDSTKFSIEEEIIVPTDLRDFNVYKLKVNSVEQNTNPIEFYVVVCHLKASSGADNELRRFNMVAELDNYLNSLPADSNIVLGGDLNLYTASEPAFQELLDATNHITFADPANRVGSWSNNPSFVDVFTQSTRTQSGLGGTSGGFDDRFDFILTSENMLSTTSITYVPDSYQVYGNNELSACYNSAINSTECGLADSEFSFAIRDALHNFSDHLPVTVSLQTDASLSTIASQEISAPLMVKQTVINTTLTIYNSDYTLSNKTVVIYNSLGQVVQTLTLNSNPEQNLDLSQLQMGMYYIKVKDYAINPVKFIISN